MSLSYSKVNEGVAVITGPLGTLTLKTATCGHCGKILIVAPFTDGQDSTGIIGAELRAKTDGDLAIKREGSHVCHQCWQLVCDLCHHDGRCVPLLKKLEEEEARYQSLKSMGF